MEAALITGASSGIGFELAKVFAKNNHNVVLIARTESKLEQLATEIKESYGVEAVVLAKDLVKNNAAQEVYDSLQEKGITINYLVNNAGFGSFGFFKDLDWEMEANMIDLNVKSLTHFTKVFGGDMVDRKQGKIMNVASTAAFQPGPLQAVYFATKAFVLSLSEALHNEFADHNVTVTALCPGATATGFADAADMEGKSFFKNKNIPTGKEVAEYGYKAMMKGQSVAVHGFMNNMLAQSARFMPRELTTTIVRKMQEA